MLAFNQSRPQLEYRPTSGAATAERAVTMLQRADIAVGPHRNLLGRWLRCARPWVIGLALGTASVAHTTFAPCLAAETTFDFSIAAQPLASALVRYGDVTGKEALYEGGLVDGRISGGVEGRWTPRAALRQLLVGTGLAARFVAEGTFVLELVPERQSTQPPAYWRYYALVQEDVLDALCRVGEARPGQYRLVTVFWIAPDGTVAELLRVGSVGRTETDQSIDRTLRGLRFREPPPAGFLQPIRLLFVPQLPGANSGCAAVDARLRAQGNAP